MKDQGQRVQELICCQVWDPGQSEAGGLRSPAPRLWVSLSCHEASWNVRTLRAGRDALQRSVEFASARPLSSCVS